MQVARQRRDNASMRTERCAHAADWLNNGIIDVRGDALSSVGVALSEKNKSRATTVTRGEHLGMIN